ncbi:hypothetical protein [Solicola sp. PLA-1-18]|uniref:hypothetical protein n=1 Tax=Solicola sp. PLA-1-18 TaxID=3380532 RepID=UPI003B79A07E
MHRSGLTAALGALVLAGSALPASGATSTSSPDDQHSSYPLQGVNPPPIRTIAGPDTLITRPDDCIRDAAGNLWVTNYSKDYTPQILVFDPNANGNVAPARVLTDPAVGRRAFSLTQAPDGAIWASYASYEEGPRVVPGQIRVYAPTASGRVTPIRTVSDGWGRSFGGVQFDREGNIYVASGEEINVYDSAARGVSLPRRTMRVRGRGVGTSNLTWSSQGEMMVSSWLVSQESISTFDPYGTGDVRPVRSFGDSAQGETWTGGANDLATDRAGNVYVAAGTLFGNVAVHPDTASGSPSPTVVLGAVRRFDTPSGIAVDRSGQLSVCFNDDRNPRVEVFDPLVAQPPDLGEPFPVRPVAKTGDSIPPVPPTTTQPPAPITPRMAVPPRPSGPRVSGKAASVRRTISWRPSRASSRRPVTDYVVRLSRGGRTLLTRRVTASHRQIVLSTDRLGPGRIRVAIRARNAIGVSEPLILRPRLGVRS